MTASTVAFPKITLNDYTAVSRPELLRIVTIPGLPLHLRVWLVAQAKVNSIGHAEFGKGELARATAERTVDPGTGEVQDRKASASTLSTAIKRAKELELLDPSSNARCLVLPAYVAQYGKGSKSCREHGIQPGKFP